jgi:hypothetical protein
VRLRSKSMPTWSMPKWSERKRLRSPFVLAAVVAVVVAVPLGIAFSATLALVAVAAVAAVITVGLAWRSTDEQKQMATDIRQLAELTGSSIEEARAQRPEPAIRFLIDGDGFEGLKIERVSLDRQVDTETIVEAERAKAIATLPRELDAGESATLARLGIPDLSKTLGAWGVQQGPATPEEIRRFEQSVDSYIDRLRSWVSDYEAWRKLTWETIRFRLLFENSGRVVCEGLRTDVYFPDPFDEAEEDGPSLDPPPEPPCFRRRSPMEMALGNHLTAARYRDIISPVSLPRGLTDSLSQRNVSSPRYRKGSVHLEITIKKLLHGLPEQSDEIVVRAPEDGSFKVPWTIWAENLPEPARGELQIELTTTGRGGPPVATFDELRELVEPYLDRGEH